MVWIALLMTSLLGCAPGGSAGTDAKAAIKGGCPAAPTYSEEQITEAAEQYAAIIHHFGKDAMIVKMIRDYDVVLTEIADCQKG